MTGMVRTQSLRGYRELVLDLGGEPDRLLRKAGIEPTGLNHLTAFIHFANLIDLLERSAAELRCADFGLRLAERQDIGILGTLAVAMQYSATVGEAISCASKYIHVYNAAIGFTVTTGEPRGQARLAFRTLVEHAPQWAQTAEHGIGLAWRIMNMLSEGQCHPKQVWFPHMAVAAEPTYRAHFDAAVIFRADQLGLTYAARDLHLPIIEQNKELHDLATAYLDRQRAEGELPLSVETRRIIEALLGTGTCSQRQVANALYMHPRTLQRRLNEEGTTFEAIKDEVRKDLARRYLSQPDLPLAQVSMLLDYSEPSALGRSCRRWFGTTPGELRDRLSSRAPVVSLTRT